MHGAALDRAGAGQDRDVRRRPTSPTKVDLINDEDRRRPRSLPAGVEKPCCPSTGDHGHVRRRSSEPPAAADGGSGPVDPTDRQLVDTEPSARSSSPVAARAACATMPSPRRCARRQARFLRLGARIIRPSRAATRSRGHDVASGSPIGPDGRVAGREGAGDRTTPSSRRRVGTPCATGGSSRRLSTAGRSRAAR